MIPPSSMIKMGEMICRSSESFERCYAVSVFERGVFSSFGLFVDSCEHRNSFISILNLPEKQPKCPSLIISSILAYLFRFDMNIASFHRRYSQIGNLYSFSTQYFLRTPSHSPSPKCGTPIVSHSISNPASKTSISTTLAYTS